MKTKKKAKKRAAKAAPKKAAKKAAPKKAAAKRAAAPPAKPDPDEEKAAKFNPDEYKVEEPSPRQEPRWVEVECPYCGDTLDVRVDPNNEEGQVLVQDCQVCCKPVQICVDVEDGDVSVYANRG